MGILEEIKERNLNDLKSVNLWKAVVAEFLGTLFLVFCGCASTTDEQIFSLNLEPLSAVPGAGLIHLPPSYVQIALSFGLSVATIVWCIAHVSGGHINPSVTIGCLAARKISHVRAIFYVIAQMSGAIAGAGILYGITPSSQKNIGLNILQGDVAPGQGFGIEFMITFLLVFTVMASTDENRTDLNGSAPLTIGLAVVLGNLIAIAYTGCAMNPARAFGPSVVKNHWDYHWVYFFGPNLGGVVASLLYRFVFAAPPTVHSKEEGGIDNVQFNLENTPNSS